MKDVPHELKTQKDSISKIISYPVMRVISLVTLLCGLLFAQVGSAVEQGLFEEWSVLENGLFVDYQLQDVGVRWPLDINKGALKNIASSRDPSIWVEMVSQRRYPLVRLAGLMCLVDHRPESAVEAGIEMLLTRGPSQIGVYETVDRFLASQTNSSLLGKSISRAASGYGIDSRNCRALMGDFSHEVLSNWFHDSKRGISTPTFEAAVLERLFEDSERGKGKATVKMYHRLDSLKSIPGLPRAVYVCFSKASGPEIEVNIRAILRGSEGDWGIIHEITDFRRVQVEKIVESHGDISETNRFILAQIPSLSRNKVPR